MKIFTFLILVLALTLGTFFPTLILAESVEVTITSIVPGCGNEIIESGEECDGSNLNSQTCTSKGFASGSLGCDSNCNFNTYSCVAISTGGGGGGGFYVPPTPSASTVIFSGNAYPKSHITLLQDAQIVATSIAGEDAQFSIQLEGVSIGNYIFSVYGEDLEGYRSPLLTFPVGIATNATTKVSGIFIAPTIAVDKKEVRQGDPIKIFGQAPPESEIVITVNSEEEKFIKIDSDQNGVYLYSFDTSFLEKGQHFTKSKASKNGTITSSSKTIGFAVGSKNVAAEKPEVISKGDVNTDRRVNLVDFSIAAYWYKKADPPKNIDLNTDGKIDLIDFSIMAFYWTG